MAPPISSQYHVDMLLTNLSVAFLNEMTAYVASKVFPTLPVNKQSDRYVTFPISSFLRARAQKRNLAEESAGSGYDIVNTNTYYADEWAIHHDIPDQERTQSDDPLEPDVESMEFVSHSLMLTLESQWVTNFFATSIWDTEVTGVSGAPGAGEFQQWNEPGSTPIQDVRRRATTVQSLTGRKPNVLVINPSVLQALEDHGDIVERVKYVSKESVTPEILAKMFRVDDVLIAESVVDSAAEGLAANIDFTVPNHALLAYRPPRPGRRTPSAGYNFTWKLPHTNGALTVAIEKMRMDLKHADRVEGTMAFALELVSSALGVFFLNAVA